MGEDVHERLPDRSARRRREVPGDATSAPWRTSDRDVPSTDRARTTATRRRAIGTRCARDAPTYPEPPVVFLIEEYYSGQCNGVEQGDCSAEVEQAALDRALEDSIEIGPGTHVLTGDGLYEPPADVVERARAAAAAAAARFEDPPGPLDDLPHQARVLAGLFALAVLPGLLAAPFFGLRDTPSRIALIPGTSIVMSLLAGIAVLGVWRGPLTETKAWVVVGVAVGAGAALRFGSGTILRTLGRVRRLLQPPVLAVLEPRLRDPDERAVPDAGGTGGDPGRDRRSRSPSAGRRASTCRTCPPPTTCCR